MEQLVVFDTASSLLLIKCCTNCLRPWAFDSAKSKTFVNLKCISCELLKGCYCDQFNHSTFKAAFADGTIASGGLAKEQLIFQTSDEGITIKPIINLNPRHSNHINRDHGTRDWKLIFGQSIWPKILLLPWQHK